MAPDPILFAGGCLFLALAFVGRRDKGRLWRLYSKERAWRARNPQMPADWERVAGRHATIYLVLGLITLAGSVLLNARP